MPIGIRFPFQNSPQGGVYATTKTTAEAIRTNLLSLLTTKRGHRVMDNNLYSPLYDYLFEPFDEIAETELDKDLRDKIQEYIPSVKVDKIDLNFDETNYTLTTKIIYSIPTLGNLRDQVTLTLNAEN